MPIKTFDIHTQKELSEDVMESNPIASFQVKEYVYNNIDFELSDKYWNLIDDTFAEIWNNKIGRGGYFYWDEITGEIFSKFQHQKLLISFEQVNQIVELILTYFEDNDGMLD